MCWRTPILAISATLILALAGCAVKPPMRYLAPDGSVHDAHQMPVRRAPAGTPRSAPVGEGERGPEVPTAPTADPVRAHFTTALGHQASGRWGEALATYRGVVEADPEGPLAGRALVRMAEIHLEPAYHAADPERARALLHEVLARFPGTAAAGAAEEWLGGLPAGE